jgi:excisionase family DNA binding protein
MENYLLTVREASKALGIGRSTLYGLVMNGDIKSIKIGSSRRIKRSDLEAYVESLN